MRCREVEAVWDDLRQGPQTCREAVLAHLRSCAHCQALYKENEGVAYCLSCLPVVEPPRSLVPKILEHLKSFKADGWATMLTPLGPLYIAFRESGITAIAIDRGEDPAELRAEVERRLRRPLRSAALPPHVREVIETYFRTWSADLHRVDISGLSAFDQAALRQAAMIPPGEVRSYGWVAAAIGRPQAARAVGGAMARNPVPLLYPCHRVVDAGGDLHNYGYGLEMKRRILIMEGCDPGTIRRRL